MSKIDIKECTQFEQMLLHIAASIKIDDIREDTIKNEWLPIGEVDRYCKFDIEWTDCPWIEELITLDDNDKLWELENAYQQVAVAAAKLYNVLKEKGRVK